MAKIKATKKEVVQKTKSRQEVIYEAVLWVDWDKVRKVMKFLKWTWATCDDKTPTTLELKEEAISLLDDVFEMYDSEKKLNGNLDERVLTLSSGGVFAKLEISKGEVLTVSCGFMLEEYFTDMVENDLIEVEQ